MLALVSLAIVEADDGNVAAARAAAADGDLDTAESYGLPGYHGIAPAFAVAARTGHRSRRRPDPARHAVELARRGTTNLGLAYVLTSCGDTLLDLGDDARRGAARRGPRGDRPLRRPRHRRPLPDAGRLPAITSAPSPSSEPTRWWSS